MAEEAALECQLEEQLAEHRASLAMLREALAHDRENREISLLCEELVAAVRDCEESLVYLKRSRLLREIGAASSSQPDAAAPRFVVGSKCRFRFTDGRWYNGKIMDLQDGGNALVSFLTPTSDRMQSCKFFLQKRCRFGDSCRSSHGFEASISSLRSFSPCKPEDIETGSVVLASSSENGAGVWRNAEVEQWDRTIQRGRVVFTDDGSRSNVDADSVVLKEHADSSSASSESEAEEETEADDSFVGIGYVNVAGQQSDRAAFATWEKHTRGVASKIMARMGYRAGAGLGLNAQGAVAPLHVRVLPPRTSLDFVSETAETNSVIDPTKRKSRGGKRKRDKKFAEAARAAKTEESSSVFDFINVQLASKNSSASKKKMEVAKEESCTLYMKEDEVKKLVAKVAKLEEMVHRNRKDKPVFQLMSCKLAEARKALQDAQEARSSMAKAALRQKEWSKF